MNVARAAWLSWAASLAACSGSIDPGRGAPTPPDRPGAMTSPMGGTSGMGGTSPTNPPPPTGMTTPPTGSDPGTPAAALPVMPLRRLTRLEYVNTIRDLTGIRLSTSKLPGEPLGSSGFSTPGIMSELEFTAYRDAAESVATQAHAAVLKSLACPAQDDACATAFLTQFGRRAFRRPIDARERDVYLTFFKTKLRGELGYTFPEAFRALMAALLQSPAFLYRWELGAAPATIEGTLVRLNAHEMASRLSYFLWSSMPDAELFAAADAGRLQTPAEIEAQAQRMLKDPRAVETVKTFVDEWLQIGQVTQHQKDSKLYPSTIWSGSVADAMDQEMGIFATKVILEGDARFSTLMTGTFSFVNEALARVYGVTGVTGSAFVRAELDPNLRKGLLTRAAFLTVTANAYDGDPIKRGKEIRERVLCHHLAPPPGDVPPLPAAKPEWTVRQRLEAHLVDPSCKGCHLLTDPIGYGFGAFDAIGGHRPTEAGKAIDTSGQVVNIDGATKSFQGVSALIDILATSAEVRGCFARQWLRFALRRDVVAADDESLRETDAAFGADGNIQKMLVGLARSKALRYRAGSAGEVLK